MGKQSNGFMPSSFGEKLRFTERERAALAWTEAVTLVAQSGVPDDIYQFAQSQFSEKELVDLTMVIIAINSWNRLAVSFRSVAGTYQPTAHSSVA
jgi:alkylhydroperoxidase family enzyme